jgi:deoxyribodipyrimidine photolyase-related protein
MPALLIVYIGTFIIVIVKKLYNNPRIGMMYKTWDRMESKEQQQILLQAEKYLSKLDNL